MQIVSYIVYLIASILFIFGIKKLGSPKTANIIALGVLVKKTAVIKPASVREAIKEIFNGKTSILNSNLKAFETGLTYG